MLRWHERIVPNGAARGPSGIGAMAAAPLFIHRPRLWARPALTRHRRTPRRPAGVGVRMTG